MVKLEGAQEVILEVQRQLRDASIDYWVKYVFNTWQWWVNIGTLILPVILWWKLANKKILLEILLYGFITSSFTVFFDTIGETLVLWDYPYLVIPMDYILIDTDYAVLPVAYMLAYQYFPRWKDFIVANTVISAVFSFVAEPMLVWLGFYEIHGWKYIYSFPIYIGIAIISKWMTKFLVKKQITATKNIREP
ncbi:CBO0543 family protein [Anaerosolibacter sp.]|uniref:CBO0543 family protein n=1 Tax=Anaerosolibacter sp. TaxID=1872527 RepID=UPI0039F0B8E7